MHEVFIVRQHNLYGIVIFSEGSSQKQATQIILLLYPKSHYTAGNSHYVLLCLLSANP